jgi:coenzyme F420 hydrogenase subunit beta
VANYIKNIEQVVLGGYCVGCGACAVGNNNVSMKMNDEGQYIPISFKANQNVTDTASKICPFSTDLNEDDIANKFLNHDVKNNYKKHIGYVDASYAGYVNEGEFRANGSSGGMVSWISSKLLELGEIDALIHIKNSTKENTLFEYGISYDLDSIQEGAKSRYYPIKLDEIMEVILKSGDKKYAIVGIPCFIKSVRLLMLNNELLSERIKYCIGIVCGHLKSTAFAELLAWQQGVSPSQLETVDFRRKLKYRGASSYGFSSTSKEGKYKVTPMASLQGGDWGQGLFKLKSCEFCDDVFAETADAVIGDAWLPGYRKDSKGTNVVLSRNKLITRIIEDGIVSNSLNLESISEDLAFQSQSSGVRHRTEGLAYRIKEQNDNGIATPKKRVTYSDYNITEERAEIYRLRESVRVASHVLFKVAKEKNDLPFFMQSIMPLINIYKLNLNKSRFNVFKNNIKIKLNQYIRVLTGTYNKEIYSKENKD